VTATTTSGGGTGAIVLSQGHNAWASSSEDGATAPAMAFDGDTSTRWSSSFQDNQWLNVDLGATRSISKVVLNWEAAYASGFKVQTSDDRTSGPGRICTARPAATGGVATLPVSGSGATSGLLGQTRATPYGISLYEFPGLRQLTRNTAKGRPRVRCRPSPCSRIRSDDHSRALTMVLRL